MASADQTQLPVQHTGVHYLQQLQPSHLNYGESAPAPTQHAKSPYMQTQHSEPQNTQTQPIQHQYIQPPQIQQQYVQPRYIQPHYAASGPPTSFIAELPAPLPIGPETSTPQHQLEEDEQLARKLVQLEVQEVRDRPNSEMDQQEHSADFRPQDSPALSHQSSSQVLRSDSQRLSPSVPVNPESYGPPPGPVPDQSSLPEVVPQLPSGIDGSRFPEVVPGSLPTMVEPLSGPGSLSAYLEKYGHVPYPPQWKLAPAVTTLYAHTETNAKANWLDAPDSCTWHTTRQSQVLQSSSHPLYAFKFKTREGSTFRREPKHSWVMTCSSPDETAANKKSKNQLPLWEYELRLDRDTGVRKHESLNPGGKRAILTTYVHASNYDSLRFIGSDGRAYQWVSQVPLGYTNGARHDTLRHALFAETGCIRDPLYGEIVADHTFWDGFVNGRPNEVLCIRSPAVQRALVVATLQVLKDWQKRTLRKYREKDPEGFNEAECLARAQDLGVLSHWRGSDRQSK